MSPDCRAGRVPPTSPSPGARLLVAVLLAVTVGLQGCASGPSLGQLPAEELHARGQAEFQEEDWGDAAELLDRLLLAHPTFPEAAAARLMLARAYFNDEKYLTAHQEYQRFLDRNRGHPRAPEAALGMCRSYAELSPIPERDQDYTQRALTTCQRVVQDYTGIDDEVADEASEITNRMRHKLAQSVYQDGSFYYDREWWDSAIIYFEFVVEDYADTVWAPRAMDRIIEVYQELGYREEVAEWRQRLQDSYPDSPEARAHREGSGAVADTSAVDATGIR